MMSEFSPVYGPRSRGFTFVELLFAIAVLGIGFIMIAAIFPVGLQQTKLSLDETTGAAGSRSMAARLQQVAQGVVIYEGANPHNIFPRTFLPRDTPANPGNYPGQVRTLNDPRPFVSPAGVSPERQYRAWQSIANDLINPADPRSAAAVLFKRDAIVTINSFTDAPTAQVIVVNAQVSGQSVYGPLDVAGTTTTLTPKQAIFNLEPRPVAVQIVYDPTNQNYVASFFSVAKLDEGGANALYKRGGYPVGSFAGPPNIDWDDIFNEAVNAVGEGAFVVISDDRITTASSAGRLNGRTFRLGNRRTDLSGLTFDLAPGYDFTPDAGADGKLNDGNASPAVFSTDDLIGVGVDKSAAPLRSGIVYAGGRPEQPKGKKGPDGGGVDIAGTAANKGAVAFVLGRGFSNSSITPPGVAGNASLYAGPVQDVSLYTTFVSVPKP